MTLQLRRTFVIAVVLLSPALGTPGHLHAQAAGRQSPRIAPGTAVEPAQSFDHMLTSFEKEFTSAAQAMPASSYSFAPSAAIFTPAQKSDFKGVRTFGQQVTHVAAANYEYASLIGGLKLDVDIDALARLTSKDEILAALAASFAYAHKAMANLTEKNAFESLHETDTRASLAGGLIAHGYDHYGQLVEYLRMNGITPPSSMK